MVQKKKNLSQLNDDSRILFEHDVLNPSQNFRNAGLLQVDSV